MRNYAETFGNGSIDAVVVPPGSCAGSDRHQHEIVAGRYGDAALCGRPPVELPPEADSCCGFGGTFAIKNAGTSTAMLSDKLRNIAATGAGCCTAGDSSLVPALDVCVVPLDTVEVGGVPEAMARLVPERPTTLISGPSATSDIELERVEGVHGPRTLVVVVVIVGWSSSTPSRLPAFFQLPGNVAGCTRGVHLFAADQPGVAAAMSLIDRFRKRSSPHDRTESAEDVPTVPPSGYQQTASKLHAFNRYEIKYFVDEMKVPPELRAELAARMETDPFSPHGGYPVTSLYYDTADLRFYWEKIEGLKFRRKLRMRLYGNPADCTDDTSVQIEIKQRVNRVTQKRRIALPTGWRAGGWTGARRSSAIRRSVRSYTR